MGLRLGSGLGVSINLPNLHFNPLYSLQIHKSVVCILPVTQIMNWLMTSWLICLLVTDLLIVVWFADKPTHSQSSQSSRIRTGRLADWAIRRLVNLSKFL